MNTQNQRKAGPVSYLNICDGWCDHIGIVKEVFKTGGCTCDVCGFSFP